METMICLCDRETTFGDDEFQKTCECGLVLVRTEEVEAFDDEPGDIDDDRFTDPYTGGHEDMGYDDGRDEMGDDGCFYDE
jgi:hypothetical protein